MGGTKNLKRLLNVEQMAQSWEFPSSARPAVDYCGGLRLRLPQTSRHAILPFLGRPFPRPFPPTSPSCFALACATAVQLPIAYFVHRNCPLSGASEPRLDLYADVVSKRHYHENSCRVDYNPSCSKVTKQPESHTTAPSWRTPRHPLVASLLHHGIGYVQSNRIL